MKIEDIDTNKNQRFLVKRLLGDLRRDVLSERLVSGKEFITRRQKVMLFLGFVPHKNWLRSFSVFSISGAAILFVIAGLGKIGEAETSGKQILGATTVGLEQMAGAGGKLSSRDFGSAAESLKQASESFKQARVMLAGGGAALSFFAKLAPSQVNLDDALYAANLASDSLARLSVMVEAFGDTRFGWDSASNSSSREFYGRLKTNEENLLTIQSQLDESIDLFSKLSTRLIPDGYRDDFFEGLAKLREASSLVSRLRDSEGFLLRLFGSEKKTYLVIFQNNNEARATGGFIGTYGLVELGEGQAVILKIETIYNPDGQLTEQIAAPGPLQRLATKYWGMRDANWFADFPASSQKLLEFLEKSSGMLADGVISFTPDVFEDMLGITGPIVMSDYGETLTRENFREVVQRRTSYEYDRKLNQPKKFLADFAPVFLDSLSRVDKTRWPMVLAAVAEAGRRKNFLFYSLDKGLERSAAEMGFAGEVLGTSGDYMSIIHSNVGGGKTDQGIKQFVKRQVEVSQDGTARVTLTIERNHQSYEEKYFPKNVDFMRVFAPYGSKLLSAKGFDDHELLASKLPEVASDPDLFAWGESFARDEPNKMFVGRESGYTVFANWLELMPGQSKSVEIQFELPFHIEQTYSLFVQKQSGASAFDFELVLDMPGQTVFSYPSSMRQAIDSDKMFGVVSQ